MLHFVRNALPRFRRTPGRSAQHSFPGFTFFYLVLFTLVALGVNWLPLPYGPNQLDLEHLYQAPFQREPASDQAMAHWLGTDQLGRDVGVNLLYGCQTAILVSLPAMVLAMLLGLLLGGLAGFFGDGSLKVSRAAGVAFPVSLLLGYFYGFSQRKLVLQEAFAESIWVGLLSFGGSLLIFLSVFSLGFLLQKLLQRIPHLRRPVSLPVDQVVLKAIALLTSLPNLVLILLFASLTKPSIGLLIVISGLTYWTEPARLVRAEMLRIRSLPYVEAVRALGAMPWYILFRHALPNALAPILVAFAFGMTRLMALESTLSFLGIGVPPDVPSWGRLVNGLRSNPEAWWLVVFPGVLLCLTVLRVQAVAQWALQKLKR